MARHILTKNINKTIMNLFLGVHGALKVSCPHVTLAVVLFTGNQEDLHPAVPTSPRQVEHFPAQVTGKS